MKVHSLGLTGEPGELEGQGEHVMLALPMYCTPMLCSKRDRSAHYY